MKISYLITAYGSIPNGVGHKVMSQVSAWKMSGHKVALSIVMRDGEGSGHAREMFKSLNLNCFLYGKKSARLRAIRQASIDVMSRRPDLVYHRFDLGYAEITKLARKIPMILEINSDDVREYRQFSFPMQIYNRITRGRLLAACAGACFVSEEIRSRHRFKAAARHSIMLANGISLEEIEPLPAAVSRRPRLVFLADQIRPWHGVDRLIKLARTLEEFDFDLIGEPTVETRHLFVDPPANLKLHEVMATNAFREILRKADVGISSLAFDRIGISEASPLKNREYLACGLPIVTSFIDSDFPNGAPFILMFDSSLDPSDPTILDSIRRFVINWQGRRIDRESIEHIGVAAKEKQRLSFFESILECGR